MHHAARPPFIACRHLHHKWRLAFGVGGDCSCAGGASARLKTRVTGVLKVNKANAGMHYKNLQSFGMLLGLWEHLLFSGLEACDGRVDCLRQVSASDRRMGGSWREQHADSHSSIPPAAIMMSSASPVC